MELAEWKEKNRYTYFHLAELFGIDHQKIQKICLKKVCVKVDDAHKIVVATKGAVDYADLLTGDC